MLKLLVLEASDTLVVLGDCVDRGPESRQVIDELLALRERCNVVPLPGPPEETLLSYLDGKYQPDAWLEVGGAATVRSYSAKSNPRDILPDHVEYIRTWPDYYETSSHFFVHANYEPDRRLPEQHWQSLRWRSLKTSTPGPHLSGKTAVVGHTSQKSGEVRNVGHLVCIDTYCWGGEWLTALDTGDGHVWQVAHNGKTSRESRLQRPQQTTAG